MKEKFIETAKIIISQNNCKGIFCGNCPASQINNGKNKYCADLFNSKIPNVSWFKNWLKENEKAECKPMTKIQMTEEQARKLLIDIKTSPIKYVSEEVINNTIAIMKEKGYIKKSELQQLVEEAEEMYMESGSAVDGMDIPNRFRRLKEICDKQAEAIEALKSTHPEFKK